MVKLLVGLLKGAVIGGAIGYGAFALSDATGFDNAWLTYGVLGMLGMANRWTFYIDKDGKIQAIDTQVKPATSAEDLSAKLHELGTPTRSLR